MRIRSSLPFGLFVGALLLAVACGGGDETPPPTAAPPRTPVPGVKQSVAQTESYRIEIWTGPALTMMTMMEAFPIMSTMDGDQPVNRHIEVHLYDVNTGEDMMSLIPVVKITNQATGVTRELPGDQEIGISDGVSFVTACLISGHRQIEPHFGDNIYLPDGKYTVTVDITGETASFEISL